MAGATRGAGRAIAYTLGEAGAVVYWHRPTTKQHASPVDQPSETIEETTEMVARMNGSSVSVVVDHTDHLAVAALIGRIRSEEGRLDILVNDMTGDAHVDGGSEGGSRRFSSRRRG